MASADLRKELDCPICLSVYANPVTLSCGHNFCQGCIGPLLDTQRAGGYSCPGCREEFPERPSLRKNVTLSNIVKAFQSSESAQEKTGISCTYCIHTSVPAVKSCLQCDASLCEDHLGVHSKSPDHVLSDPTANQEARKCSTHKKILEYYCSQDSACICTSCSISEEHWGHLVEMMKEDSEKKKEELRNVLQEMTTKKGKLEKRVRILQERRRKWQGDGDGQVERVAALFRDIRRQLEDLEKTVLNEISQQAEQASLSDLIQKLEIKKDKLSKEMGHIEDLCSGSDPVILLYKPSSGDLCDTEEEDYEDAVDAEGSLDVTKMLHVMGTICDIINGVNLGFYRQEVTELLLDVDTAYQYLKLGKNSVSRTTLPQQLTKTPKRFEEAPQVLSLESFSSGQHYWDVDMQWCSEWSFGLCYPSMDGKGKQARIGNNDKSWALAKWNDQLSVIHDRKAIQLPHGQSSRKIRLFLDYEAGQISFYYLCDPIRHVHTISAAFTEPLHVALALFSKECSLSF